MPARTKQKKGLSVKTYGGLSKKRMASGGSGGMSKRVAFKKEEPTVPLQFLQPPEDFIEYDIHAFQEDGRWQFVPCTGADSCPLCDDEDDQVRRLSYRFACNVLNLANNKVQILEGPKDLATRIYHKYERAPQKFLKRVWDVSRYQTTPISYSVDLAEDLDPVATRGKKSLDLDEYLTDELKSYYGPDLENIGGGALAADDDDGDDDEAEEKPSRSRRAKPAAEEEDDDTTDDDDLDDDEDDEDLDDEDTDDEDDADDEDDDDEDDEDEDTPPARARGARKSSAAAPRKSSGARKSTSARKRR